MAEDFLSTKRINDILDRHYGSKRALAREAGVCFGCVTNVLRGKVISHRVLVIAERHAREYLAAERRERKHSAEKAPSNKGTEQMIA
jgi:hypothetical protein